MAPTPAVSKVAAAQVLPASTSRKKLSYREQKELADLPDRIQALEAEQQRLNTAVAAPNFYKEPADIIKRTLARVDALRDELLQVYARWSELDSRTKS
jgi:ATP-binding cassette subfamily F protein uup